MKTARQLLAFAIVFSILCVGALIPVYASVETVPADLLMKATQDTLDKCQMNGCTLTGGITDAANVPAPGATSIKLHTNATTQYPQFFFWNKTVPNPDAEGAEHSSWGPLFGEDVDCREYDGIRVWVKYKGASKHARLIIVLGEDSSYTPKAFYEFKRTVPEMEGADADGFEGWLNLAWEDFTLGSDGVTCFEPSEVIDFFGFKFAGGGKYESDLYFSGLQLYSGDPSELDGGNTATTTKAPTTTAAPTTTKAPTTAASSGTTTAPVAGDPTQTTDTVAADATTTEAGDITTTEAEDITTTEAGGDTDVTKPAGGDKDETSDTTGGDGEKNSGALVWIIVGVVVVAAAGVAVFLVLKKK